MRRRPPSPRALTRSLPWYALAALITVTLYWNFDAHVEAHGEPGVDLMARQEIARITERVRMLEDLGVSGLRSLRTKTERDPEKEQASRGDLLPESATAPVGGGAAGGGGGKSAPSWTWPGARPSESVTIPPLGNERSVFFTEQTQKNLATLPEWYRNCVHKKATQLQGSPGRFRDEQIYHILCLLEDKLSRKDLSPLVVVQVGSNDGNDAVREALIYARRHYSSIPIKVVLVEPTQRNFDRLKKVYSSTQAFQGSGFEAEFVHGAVCDDCCVNGKVKIYHPRWSLIKEMYRNAVKFPEKFPKAFDTPDGSWRFSWLYELNSLDPENLKQNFRNSEDIVYDEIACFKAASLLDAFTGGFGRANPQGASPAPLRHSSKASKSFSHQPTANFARPAVPSAGRAAEALTGHRIALSRKKPPRANAKPQTQHNTSAGKKPLQKKPTMASIPTNTARTAPLDTSVKLGAAQQRALKDLVAMGFGKQACKEALLRTGTTSMDRLLAALTGPEEPPVRKRDAAGTPKAVPRPRPRPTPQRRAPPTAAPKVGAHLKHGDVRGVASKVYTKGNAHTWIDLKTTTGDVIEVRSTQVESIELTEDEVLACSKEMAPDDWLRLRVDGLVKLPSRQGVVGNRFTASDGSEKRQLVVEGSIIRCALCEETTWDLGGDVHRNWHAAQHSIKSHCGHFASCRRGNAHVEALEKVSGKEISMEGAPVKSRASSASRPAKRARVVSQTRRMIGPKNRPASARPDSHLKLNTALHQLHPDFDGTRKFPRGRGIMPSFLLENIDGQDVTNENHEAFEQFVVCWLFNEIIPRTCRVPGKVDAKGVSVEVDETKPSIRVLELGGGIGAVSTMIQQNLQMVDQDAPHVVVEPNALLSDGPLLRNRLRHGSRFDVIRGVVSSKDKVAFGLGDINPNHPRAWMWGTIDASASRKVDVRGAPLSEVEDLLGGSPTVLVADCEGGLISLLEDYPHIIDDVVAIYYERDPPGDYTASEALLAAKGFVPVLIASLHRVVVRESALPRPAAVSTAAAAPVDATMADAALAPAAAPTAASTATPADATMADAAPTAEAATPAAKAKVEPPSPSPSPTLSSSTDDADARRAAVVARYAAELSSLVAEKEESAKKLEGLVQETRAHAQKYGAVNKELEAALLEFIEDHAEPALRAARRAKDAVAEASRTTTMTRRKLAENSRVLCGWHDDAWSDDEALEWYPGCATPSDPMDAACDVYDVVFDDGDGREKVRREELRSVFVPGAFDWASPFVEEEDEVEEEAVEGEDFPLLSNDGAEILEALRLPPAPPKKGARVRGRYKHEGTEKWFHGSVVGITCKRGRSMLLLVRYDGEDEAVDEAWPSEDLEVLAPEEDAAMAVEPAPAVEEDALPPKKRGRKEPRPAEQPSVAEPLAVEPVAEPSKPAEQQPAESKGPSLAEMATAAAQSKGPSLAEMATAAARAARQEAAAPPEGSDDSDDEPIGLVAGPRV